MDKIWSRLTLVKTQFRRQTYYRFNTLMTIAGALMAATVQFFVWKSVSLWGHSDVEHISQYAIFATSYALLIPTAPVARRISQSVMKGTVAYDMIRPISLFNLSLFLQIGHFLFTLLTVSIPLSISYHFLFGVKFPFTLSINSLSILCASFFGLFIAFEIGYSIGLLSLITTRTGGFLSMFDGLMIFLGGAYLPLNIYPSFLKDLTSLTPFASIQYFPLQGLSNGSVPSWQLITQLFWLAILICITNIQESKLRQRLKIAGG